MNYVLIRHGFPPVVIKSADKKNYLTALNKADVGDLDSFVEYIAEELVWSLDVSIKAAKSENIEEFDDVDKELSVWKRKFTSNNKGLPKSIETIDIMLSNGLSKILQDFALRCNQFKDVFPVSKVYFEYSTFRDSYNKAKKIFPSNEIDPLNISNYAHQVYLRNLNIEYNSGPLNKLFYERIDFISLIFVFEGLISDNGQIIDLEFSLVVRFEKFEYSILFDNVKVVSKRYSLNSIGSYEEDEIINKLMKLTFNLVKSKIP
jgi:hypothetical protein